VFSITKKAREKNSGPFSMQKKDPRKRGLESESEGIKKRRPRTAVQGCGAIAKAAAKTERRRSSRERLRAESKNNLISI
jgi:hypothetical protein